MAKNNSKLTEIVDEIKFDIERLQERLRALENVPQDLNYAVGTVLVFDKKFSKFGKTYRYAVVKGDNARWYVSGTSGGLSFSEVIDSLYTHASSNSDVVLVSTIPGNG